MYDVKGQAQEAYAENQDEKIADLCEGIIAWMSVWIAHSVAITT